jgi:hypothetical protein
MNVELTVTVVGTPLPHTQVTMRPNSHLIESNTSQRSCTKLGQADASPGPGRSSLQTTGARSPTLRLERRVTTPTDPCDA